MNGFDLTVLVLTAVLVVLGAWKGIVRILITLGALVAAFVLASRFHQPVADYWVESPADPSAPLRLLAYLAIFVAVMVAGGVLAWAMRKLMKVALLGWADRLAGAALGLVAAALASALLVLPVVAYTPKGESLLGRSRLAPYVAVVADVANQIAPEDLARRYRERIRELRRYWRGDDVVRRLSPGAPSTARKT